MRACLLIALAAMALTVPAADTQSREVRGTVSYRERMALPPDAILIVQIDRFHESAQSNLAELRIKLNGRQVPIAFALSWLQGKTSAGDRFGVRSEIRSGGNVLFESTSALMLGEKPKQWVQINLIRARSAPFSILEKEWSLVELQGSRVSLEKPPTLTLEADGKFSGFSGVNRMFGSYEWTKPYFQIDPMGGTLMAGSKEAMDLEQQYLKALPLATRLNVEEGQLVLLRGTAVIARFKAKS